MANGNPLSAEELQQRLQPTPPASMEEFNQRKLGWLANFQKLLDSDEAKAAMLNMGIGLLRPIQPGQTRGTNIADALTSGAQAAAGVRTSKAKAAQAAEENKVARADAVTKRIAALAEREKGGGSKAAKLQLIEHVTDTIQMVQPDMTRAEARTLATDRVLADPKMKAVLEVLNNDIDYVTGTPEVRKAKFDAAIQAVGQQPDVWGTGKKELQEKREKKKKPVFKQPKTQTKPAKSTTGSGTNTSDTYDKEYVPGVGFVEKKK